MAAPTSRCSRATRLRAGEYELVFDVGAYFAGADVSRAAVPRPGARPFRGLDPAAHYHVPLLDLALGLLDLSRKLILQSEEAGGPSGRVHSAECASP